MNQKNFRCDVNREVKNVLIRHSVNLSQINYSFIGSTAYLYGALYKDPEGDFTPTHIEYILKDLRRISQVRNIQIDLENWSIIPDVFSWIIKKRKEITLTAADRPDTVFISETEEIKNVLNDLQKKGKGQEKEDENR